MGRDFPVVFFLWLLVKSAGDRNAQIHNCKLTFITWGKLFGKCLDVVWTCLTNVCTCMEIVSHMFGIVGTCLE